MNPLAVRLATSSMRPPDGDAHNKPTPKAINAPKVCKAIPVPGNTDLQP
jgi:hypothetical protein